jgi:hypothetical protein
MTKGCEPELADEVRARLFITSSVRASFYFSPCFVSSSRVRLFFIAAVCALNPHPSLQIPPLRSPHSPFLVPPSSFLLLPTSTPSLHRSVSFFFIPVLPLPLCYPSVSAIPPFPCFSPLFSFYHYLFCPRSVPAFSPPFFSSFVPAVHHCVEFAGHDARRAACHARRSPD